MPPPPRCKPRVCAGVCISRARTHVVTLMHTRDRTQGEASKFGGEWNVTEEPTTGQPNTVRTHTHFHACTHACMHAIANT
jgi:hypothetical protein